MRAHTHLGGTIATGATSAFGAGTSGAASVGGDITSGAASVGGDVTSAGGAATSAVSHNAALPAASLGGVSGALMLAGGVLAGAWMTL
jgi:hypothetical protein